MKKSYLLSGTCVYLLFTTVSCSNFYHGDHDTSISISENGSHYKMSAYYNKQKTARVQSFMEKQLRENNDISFTNTIMDATLTLDDKTTFYIKSFPGKLEINLDKDKNSSASYREIKQMCEGIKDELAKD